MLLAHSVRWYVRVGSYNRQGFSQRCVSMVRCCLAPLCNRISVWRMLSLSAVAVYGRRYTATGCSGAVFCGSAADE